MKTTMNKKLGVWVFVLFGAMAPTTLSAQDKVEASVGADLVSSYIWRGQDLGGVSLQPLLSIAYKGFSLGAWGSVGIDKEDTKELDFTLAYGIGGFSISLTDYWFNQAAGEDGEIIPLKYFSKGKTNHLFEAQVGYDFGPIAVNWYTNIGGADGVKANGKRAYSSYVSVAAPFKLGGLDFKAELAAVPWETTFYNGYTSGFAVSSIALEAAKVIKITDSFTLPAFAKVTVNPCIEDAYFTFGLSF